MQYHLVPGLQPEVVQTWSWGMDGQQAKKCPKQSPQTASGITLKLRYNYVTTISMICGFLGGVL
jgi:hypothetical protein